MPLNVPTVQIHVLSQDLVQGMPLGGEGGLSRHPLDLLSVPRALPTVVITRSSRRPFADTLRLDNIVFLLVAKPMSLVALLRLHPYSSGLRILHTLFSLQVPGSSGLRRDHNQTVVTARRSGSLVYQKTKNVSYSTSNTFVARVLSHPDLSPPY